MAADIKGEDSDRMAMCYVHRGGEGTQRGKEECGGEEGEGWGDGQG